MGVQNKQFLYFFKNKSVKQLEYKSRSFKAIKFRKKRKIKNTVFDKDVTTLLLQIGTSSGGFEHPVLKCSSLPKNALKGGLRPPLPLLKEFLGEKYFLSL